MTPLPRSSPPPARRILIIQPCCIGDVIMATAALGALRRAYPEAHIAWAVGTWSRPALAGHPHLDALIDTGSAALPVATLGGLVRFARLIAAGDYDLLVSFVRSPKMSLAALLSGVRVRAGIDSAGRGFGYTIRTPVDPDHPRHEAAIYLDVVRALGVDITNARTFVGAAEADREVVAARLHADGITGDYLVVHAGGGRNPGMTMDVKRYPPAQLGALAGHLAARLSAQIVVIGGPDDDEAVWAVCAAAGSAAHGYPGGFTFGQIGALAVGSALYLGSDTGLTHYAAAAGAPTAMILGPSDPARYAPLADRAIALWRPTDRVLRGGVGAGTPLAWDWARDGISVADAEAQIAAWLGL